MKPLLTLSELTDLISAQKNGIANATRQFGKHKPMGKELWRIVVKARSKRKDISDTDFKQSTFHKLHDEGTAYDEKIIGQLLDNLRDFLEMYFNSCQINTALGQVKLAETLRKQGHAKRADKVNEKAYELAKEESESTQHFVNFAIERVKYKKDKENNSKSLETSRLERKKNYLIDYFESTIEELMICRIKEKEITASTKKELEIMLLLVPEKSPLIKVQAEAARNFLNPSIEAYWRFRKAFFDNVDSIFSYKSDLLRSLINAIATYPNITNEMGQDYLVLYRFGIENALFMENGEIPALMFDNIVYIAQSRRDFALIELAINSFENIITGEKSKERSFAVAQAYLHYSKHEHDAISGILKFLDNDNYLPFHLVLRKYILGFKSAYEKSPEKQTALVYMDFKEGSFRSILSKYERKHISKTTKRNYLNFFNILYRVADRNNNENTKQNLKLELKKCNGAILESTWLSEKIIEL